MSLSKSIDCDDNKYAQLENKDLNSYKSLNDLYDVVDKAEEQYGDLKSKGQKEKEQKVEGAEKIINEPGFQVVRFFQELH